MSKITLQTEDGSCFTIDVEIAKHSGMIKGMLEDLGTDDLEDDKICLPNLRGHILEKVIEWATHHKNDPVLTKNISKCDCRITPYLREWDKNFLKTYDNEILKITLASDFLEISTLMNACCKYIAAEIRGLNAEQIRERFNIPRL